MDASGRTDILDEDVAARVRHPYVPEDVGAYVRRIRRELHQYPELAYKEEKTAAIIMRELRSMNIAFHYGGVGSAVIGRMPGTGKVPLRVALRADMDALPGDERTGLPFASKHPGRMHACGHDAHMAMVLGAAQLLARDPPPCEVVLVFQPAEEGGAGARMVLASGALEGVHAIYGGHVTHQLETGHILVAPGIMTSQSDAFIVKFLGKAGHGARPHEAIDAVVLAGHFILAVQTLVSRETDPLNPSVVTIGKVTAGTARNVIADVASLEGTIRTTRPNVRSRLLASLERIARGLAMAQGAAMELDIQEGYPPVINDPNETRVAHQAAAQIVGAEALAPLEAPSMGSEDFSFYLEKIPGCYVRFGARRADWEYVPLHSPQFDVDESALEVGAAFFERVVRERARWMTA